jgi:dephospho-CoA kinase
LKVIGVTGGIGSGKSAVVNYLHELGAKTLDADITARQVVEPECPALQEIINVFGSYVVTTTGHLDRTKLGNIVFNNKEKLDILNGIMHKYIVEHIISEVGHEKGTGKTDVFVIEAAIPLEHGFLDIADQIWAVVCDDEIRISSIMQRNSIPREKALSIINSQISAKQYKELADVVIENSGSPEQLKASVNKAFKQLI